VTGLPQWLEIIAWASLMIAIACSLFVLVDVWRHPQMMPVMNWVWPITMLFGGIPWLWFYFRWGRHRQPERRGPEPPMWVAVAKGTSHCGAGCTLGDLIAECSSVAWPALPVLFGLGTLFEERTIAMWIPDYIAAFLIGILFQYFSIAPMRGLGVGDGLKAALKADTASITAWQLGMYGAMAGGQFAWFKPAYGAVAPVASVEFWLLMQLAMIAGFATSYPVNWWLISAGVKERM
jgi:hypothetical protein